jgi:hypothetical protein
VTRARNFGVMALCLALVACTSGGTQKPGGGAAGGGAAGAGTAGSGAAGAGTAGQGAAGATGSAGASATAGSGAAGATPGTAGATADGGAGSSAKDAAADRDPDAGPLTTAGCANHNYQLCIDFEDGIDTTVWSGGTPNAIVTDQVAHGTHAYHLYSKAGAPTGGRLLSKTVGTIKNQVWARFYIHFSPGAPGGHGNIVAAYDKSGTWYEMGYQFDGMMGVWHGGGGEHPRRSLPYIVDRWYCIEAYFDGASAAMPKWYIDGAEASYWNPVESCGTPMITCDNEAYTCTNGQIACDPTGTMTKGVQTVVEAGPTPSVSTQFTRLEAGFTPYAPLDLKPPNNVGDQSDTRVLTDLWIDDVAFDTQRIGCIE